MVTDASGTEVKPKQWDSRAQAPNLKYTLASEMTLCPEARRLSETEKAQLEEILEGDSHTPSHTPPSVLSRTYTNLTLKNVLSAFFLLWAQYPLIASRMEDQEALSLSFDKVSTSFKQNKKENKSKNF